MVSVIIPNYNNSTWLRACLLSCINQGDLLEEIIVIDDHSTDDSWDILTRYQVNYPNKIKLFRNSTKGSNYARNFGFEHSSGKYIQWLDADDRLLPGKLENQIVPLAKGAADIIYSDWQMDFWDDDVLTKSEIKRYKDYPDFLEELMKDNWTSPNNYLMTRDMAEKLANGVGWNPNTKVGQDREYFTMAGIMGAKFKYVAGVFAVYNKQSLGTISGIPFKVRLENNQVLEERLRTEIGKRDWIPEKKKQRYRAILDTHQLKACYYHSGIKIRRPVNFRNILWEMIHWKMRLVIPWVYLRTHLILFIDYVKSSNTL